ncbi:hypothetical protein SELMODRAFT_415036 [Selaginella moellendorffii]|uniref:Xylanase inhibitor C-terminal domain-containing protein n=1 Tax=Selaginella moellendorffii TaxID=88036 RepID=D8RUF0_SELML|nr:hypothetical protein SELMODRAFT_415036 [Selaginella moellendorffii]
MFAFSYFTPDSYTPLVQAIQNLNSNLTQVSSNETAALLGNDFCYNVSVNGDTPPPQTLTYHFENLNWKSRRLDLEQQDVMILSRTACKDSRGVVFFPPNRTPIVNTNLFLPLLEKAAKPWKATSFSMVHSTSPWISAVELRGQLVLGLCPRQWGAARTSLWVLTRMLLAWSFDTTFRQTADFPPLAAPLLSGNVKNTICMEIGRSESIGLYLNVIGTYWQLVLRVEYDLEQMRFGFGAQGWNTTMVVDVTISSAVFCKKPLWLVLLLQSKKW